jgi:glutamyl-tRNA(Gln) amidotransferase subunit D
MNSQPQQPHSSSASGPIPGDQVELTTSDGKSYTGLLLQRPALLQPGITVLKLSTGYNIGVASNTIASLKTITPYVKPQIVVQQPAHNPQLPTVALLSFGGTISSRVDYKTGGVIADYGANDFYQMIPQLRTVANIHAVHVMNVMSEDMDSSHWKTIAQTIYPFLSDSNITGVVVTQGTDTLHYSTSALSFMLDVNKPVIFTAAQRSIDRGSSDAFLNLYCAIVSAAHFDGAVVATCMHETMDDTSCILIRGTKVRKMHTSRRDAFRPINEKPLARVTSSGEIQIIQKSYPLKSSVSSCAMHDVFEPKVGLVQIHPGISPDIFTFYQTQGYKGLVISATALGHVPASTIQAIKHCVKHGMIVCIATQTIYGRTHPYVYSRLRELSVDCGVLFLEDCLTETAYVKLGWVLGLQKPLAQTCDLLLRSLKGEFTTEIDSESYLL